jgi:hypothetical protein
VCLQMLWKLSPESRRDLRIRQTAMVAPEVPVQNWLPGNRYTIGLYKLEIASKDGN